MATFDQKYQHIVGVQENADTIINRSTLFNNLHALQEEFGKAMGAPDTRDEPCLREAATLVTSATAEARKPQPDKSVVTGYLEKASKLVSGAVALAGLATALKKSAEFVAEHL